MDEHLPPSLRYSLKMIQQLEKNYGMENLINSTSHAEKALKALPKDIIFPQLNETIIQMNKLTPVMSAALDLNNSFTFESEKSEKALLAFDSTLSHLSKSHINLADLTGLYSPYLKTRTSLEDYFNIYPQFQDPLSNILENLHKNTIQENILYLQNTLEFRDALEEDTVPMEADEKIYNELQLFLITVWSYTKNQPYIYRTLFILVHYLIYLIGGEILEIADLPPDLVALFNGTIAIIEKEKKKKASSETTEVE